MNFSIKVTREQQPFNRPLQKETVTVVSIDDAEMGEVALASTLRAIADSIHSPRDDFQAGDPR